MDGILLEEGISMEEVLEEEAEQQAEAGQPTLLERMGPEVQAAHKEYVQFMQVAAVMQVLGKVQLKQAIASQRHVDVPEFPAPQEAFSPEAQREDARAVHDKVHPPPVASPPGPQDAGPSAPREAGPRRDPVHQAQVS